MKFHALFLVLCPLASGVEFLRPGQGYSLIGRSNVIQRKDEKLYEKVCYDEIGCFDNTIAGRLPSDPADIPPKYIMFSGDKQGIDMSWNDPIEVLKNKTEGSFNGGDKLIFVTHGFGEYFRKAWVVNLKNATLKAYPNASVVVIEWFKGALLPLYNRAASNVPVIANMTVRLTEKLMEIYPIIKAKDIYFIGFSLGAQIGGYYARAFYNQTGTKIGRITSLDAAAPVFQAMGVAPRRGDAGFVEAIHTSAGDNMIFGKVGYIPPYGDIDFYPNGGVSQPGCSIFSLACSHQRSFVYLTHAFEDLDECRFKGIRCDTVKEANNAKCNGATVDAYIGQRDIENFPRRDEDYHIVYMKTDEKSPFCLKE